MRIGILLSFLFCCLVSCTQDRMVSTGRETSNQDCNETAKVIVRNQKAKTFYFDEYTSLKLDLNGDLKADFKLEAHQAGNRIARMLKGLRPGNEIMMLGSKVFLDADTKISDSAAFVPEIDLNRLDDEFGNDYGTLDGKYFGLKMTRKKETHYGWIRFTSTDCAPGSPLYYSSLEITLHATGYNRSCSAIRTP